MPTVVAQDLEIKTQHTAGAFDSSYIESYNAYLMPRFLLNRKYMTLRLRDRPRDYSLVFLPNKTINAGIGATYKFATLNISKGIIQPQSERGQTRNLDVQLHSYGRRITTDVLAQFYRGFYLSDQRYASSPDLWYVRPDLSINVAGASFQYLFNNRKFSYRAAFQQTERQKKSAGTFLIGMEIYLGRFKGDSTIMPREVLMDFSENISKMRFAEFGPNAGYAYTWVYKKFFLTGSASVGINGGMNRYYSGGTTRTVTGLSPNTNVRCSAGYNVKKWAVNLIYISTALHFPKWQDRTVLLNAGNIRMNLIYRIYPNKEVRRAVRLIDRVDRELRG